jgi:hypothetical protein
MTSFEPPAPPKKAWLFHHMAIMPWPYLFILPAVFVVLIGVGWTQDNYIEEEVAKIWIPTRGSYAKNVEYAESLGEGDLAATSFAAMAIARDGGNLFTEERLQEIRQRMEKAEGTTVSSSIKEFRSEVTSKPILILIKFTAVYRLIITELPILGTICARRITPDVGPHISFPALVSHPWISSKRDVGSLTKPTESRGTRKLSASYW